MGFRGAYPLPYFGIYHWEESIGVLYFRVYMGDVEAVHFRHRSPVDRCSAHDEALVLARGFRLFVGLLERVDAGCLRDGFSPEIENYVLAAFQRAERQGEISRASHYDGISTGNRLEILKVFGDMPWEFPFDTYSVVVGYCDDETFEHKRCVLIVKDNYILRDYCYL